MPSTTLQHVPRWLIHRFPEFAELEDNSVFLRELALRYGPRRRAEGDPTIDSEPLIFE